MANNENGLTTNLETLHKTIDAAGYGGGIVEQAVKNGAIELTAPGTVAGIVVAEPTAGLGTLPVDAAVQLTIQTAADNTIQHWYDPIVRVEGGRGQTSFKVDPSSPYANPYTQAAMANVPPGMLAADWAKALNEMERITRFNRTLFPNYNQSKQSPATQHLTDTLNCRRMP